MTYPRRILWAAAALLSAEVSAAPADLKAVFEAARARSESVAKAQAIRERAQAVKAEAVGEWLPELKLLASELFSQQGNRDFQSPAVRLNARQELLSGLDQPAAVRAGNALQAQADALARLAGQALAREVGTGFFNVLALEEQLAIQRDALANADAAVKDMEQRVALGRNRRAELSSSMAQSARISAALTLTESRLREARLSLASLSGLPEDQALAVPAPVSAGAKPADEVPAVLAAREGLRLARARRLAVQGGFLPTVFAEGNWHLARQGGAAGADWDAQLGLELPLFQFGAQRARLKQADADLRVAELDLALSQRESQRERDQAEAALRLAVARVEAAQRSLEAAEKSFADQQRDFRNSLLSSLDLLRAFDAVEGARLEASNARWDAQRARLRRDLACGATEP